MSIPAGVGRPAYRLYQWMWAGLDWLYPPRCGGCEQPGARWCSSCQQKTPPISGALCEKCGQSLATPGDCPACRAAPSRCLGLRSWAEYSGPLRAAILRLKFKGDLSLGEILARPLVPLLFELGWAVDLVTPVPAGIARQAERGYNQSALLAWPLALGCGLRYQPKALFKARETRSQVGLSAGERRANLRGAFAARTDIVRGKHVLVVDDVTTTGTTLQECAGALLAAGARAVFGLTLARANWSPGEGPASGIYSPDRVGEESHSR